MPYSESFLLKAGVIPIVGVGTILLTYTGTLNAEAGAAILSALVGFLIGEANGVRKATT